MRYEVAFEKRYLVTVDVEADSPEDARRIVEEDVSERHYSGILDGAYEELTEDGVVDVVALAGDK